MWISFISWGFIPFSLKSARSVDRFGFDTETGSKSGFWGTLQEGNGGYSEGDLIALLQPPNAQEGMEFRPGGVAQRVARRLGKYWKIGERMVNSEKNLSRN